jgi:opacity protein-like surface antigen
MKRSLITALLAVLFAAPSLMAQNSENHVEVGIFADYFNLSHTSPHINFVGLGGRAGFNVRSNVQIEAEMAYDFKRDFSSTFSNGVSSELVTTRLRTLHALFGPKFGTSGGPVRLFGTFKAGLINFSVSDQNAGAGFQSALSDVTTGNTAAAVYPGAGVEGFLGPVGLRLDVGDEIYFKNGTHNNLKVTFGPTLRF